MRPCPQILALILFLVLERVTVWNDLDERQSIDKSRFHRSQTSSPAIMPMFRRSSTRSGYIPLNDEPTPESQTQISETQTKSPSRSRSSSWASQSSLEAFHPRSPALEEKVIASGNMLVSRKKKTYVIGALSRRLMKYAVQEKQQSSKAKTCG
jgi:hypothetical protein